MPRGDKTRLSTNRHWILSVGKVACLSRHHRVISLTGPAHNVRSNENSMAAGVSRRNLITNSIYCNPETELYVLMPSGDNKQILIRRYLIVFNKERI